MEADAADARNSTAPSRRSGRSCIRHRLFRPYGQGGNLDNRLLSKAVVEHLARQQATIVLWSALPRDWQDPDGWVDRALGQIAAQPWSLMVLHDLPTGAMRHLDRFLGLVGGARRARPAGLSAGLHADGGWGAEAADRRLSRRAVMPEQDEV